MNNKNNKKEEEKRCCPSCGKEVPHGNRYCSYCHEDLGEVSKL